jgi:hypothetical protein
MASSKIERLRGQLKNIREDQKERTRMGVNVAEVLGGAATGGFIQGAMPGIATIKVGERQIQTAGLLGGALIAIGVIADGEWGDDVAMVGAGLAASAATKGGADAGEAVRKFLTEK